MEQHDFKPSRTARLLLVLACALTLSALQPDAGVRHATGTAQATAQAKAQGQAPSTATAPIAR